MLKELIESKKFDYVNDNITEENFPVLANITPKEHKLFHFDKDISSEDAIEEMKKEGYNPADIYDLLNWKDWNNQDLVAALGSVAEIDGNRIVPYLSRDGSSRDLHLYWWSSDWPGYYRFLGVRNLDSQFLEKAIEICKQNGLKVTREKIY